MNKFDTFLRLFKGVTLGISAVLLAGTVAVAATDSTVAQPTAASIHEKVVVTASASGDEAKPDDKAAVWFCPPFCW